MIDILSLATVIGAAFVLPVAIVMGSGMWSRARSRRYARLKNSSERLKVVVAELLERVNDLDQQLQYAETNTALSDKLRVAASDLVTVTDCLPAIEQLLNERRFDDCADLLSASTRVLDKVKRLIDQILPQVKRLQSKSNVLLISEQTDKG